MSKAIFVCEDCKKEETVIFNVGERPNTPVCENCNKEMKRVFNKVGKGSIIPDDIMYASRMMSYQSSKK